MIRSIYKNKLIIALLLISIVVAINFSHYANDTDETTVLHDEFAKVTTAESWPTMTLLNEQANAEMSDNLFPKAFEALGRPPSGLVYTEVTDGALPTYLVSKNSFINDYDADINLFDTVRNKATKLPSGPWMKKVQCSLLQFDSGCTSNDLTMVTPQGNVFYVIEGGGLGNVYDEKTWGIYFYNNEKWYRLTREVSEYAIDTTGCILNYRESQAHDLNSFSLNVCGIFNIQPQTLENKKFISINNIDYIFSFKHSGKGNYITFSVNSYPKCTNINLELKTGDGSITEMMCGTVYEHYYSNPGEYYAELSLNGIIIEKERVVIEDIPISTVSFSYSGMKKNILGKNYIDVTYVATPSCPENFYIGNRINLYKNKSIWLGNTPECSGTTKLFLSPKEESYTLEYKVNGKTIASTTIENPHFESKKAQ